MKGLYQLILIIMMILLVILAGCSDNSNPVDPEIIKGKKFPLFVPKQVSIPVQLLRATDSSARQVVRYIEVANILYDFRQFITPANNIDSLADTTSWVVDSMTVTLTGTENDSGYQWTVILNGTSESRGVSYVDFVLMDIEQNKAGTNGNCTIYNLWQITTDPLFETQWLTQANGSISFKTVIHDNGKRAIHINITSNPDMSGKLEYFEFKDQMTDLLKFVAEWYVDGSGQCWVYNELGEVVFQGNW